MAIDPLTVHWYYSGGAANTLGSASFGGARATGDPAGKTWDLLSTITTGTGADKRVVIDTARIGDGVDAHVGKAMMIADGAAALDAGRIVAFDDATGTFVLEQPFSTAVSAADTYHLYDLNSMIDAVDAADCAFGETDYRCVYLQNQSGQTLVNPFFYHKIVGGIGQSEAPIDLELFGRIPNSTTESVRTNDQSGPPASILHANDGFVSPTLRFALHATPAFAWRNSAGTNFTSNNSHKAVWLKRIVPANTRRNDFVIVQVVAEYEDGAAAIARSGMLLVFSLAGFTPAITLLADRGPVPNQQELDDSVDAAIRLNHGARYTAEVKSVETGLVVPDLEIGWTKTGPGALFTPEAPMTDAVGIARATYSAPTAAAVTRQAIAFDRFDSAAGVDDAVTIAHNHLIGSGKERALFAFSMVAATADPPSDLNPYRLFSLRVTFNGLPMQRIAQISSAAGARLDVWQLLNPPTGNFEVRATNGELADALGLASISFSAVDQNTPLDAAVAVKGVDGDASTVWSDTITTVTAAAELVMLCMPFHPVDAALTTDAPAVFRGSHDVGAVAESTPHIATKAAPTIGVQTQSFSAVAAGTDRLGVLLALRPALVGATVSAQV